MNKLVKILIVEDSEDDAKLVLRALRLGGFDPAHRRVQTAKELETTLAQERWDAVISDFSMPGFTGLDALKIFRTTGLDIPFILVSGVIGEETAVNAMKAGASDYMMKQSLARLAPALERELKETQMRAAHQQTQRDLLQSEQRLRTIIETDPECVKVVSTGGVLLEMNAAGLAMLEADSLAAVQSRPLLDFIVPEYRAAFAALHKRVICGDKGILEYEVIGLKGRRRWLETHAAPMNGANGEGAMLLGVTRDITERKRSEESLRDSEQRFSGAFEYAPNGVALVSPDGRWLKVNRALCDLLGYSEAELLKRTFQDITYPEDLELDMEYVRRLLAGEIRTYEMEKRYVHARGHLVTALLKVSLARDDKDQPRYFISQIQDITERKQSEIRITSLNRVYAMLSSVNALPMHVRSRDELYRKACRIAVDEGGFRMSLIATVDRSTKFIVPVASAGKDEDLLTAIKGILSSKVDAPNSMVARAIREKQAVVANDSQSDPRVLIGRKYTESGVRSMAVLPLMVADEAIGVLALYAGEIEFFHEEEMNLLTGLAADIAFALDNIGKEEKIARLSRIQALMSGINAVIVRVRDSQELFNEACHIAVEHGHFGMAWIGTLDAATQDVTPVAWAGESSELLTTAKSSARDDIPQGAGAVGRAIRERRPVFNNDISAHTFGGPRAKEILRLGFRSQITMPLFEEQTVVGTLTLYAREPNFFDEEELRLLTELAGSISFALAHIDKEEKIARLSRIQAVMSGINAAIVRILDREALFNEACRIAVEQGGFAIAWIGMLNPDTLEITPAAWAGVEAESLLARVQSTTRPDLPGGRGVIGRAIREKRAAFSNDLTAEPGGGERRTEALRRGYHSTISLPLLVDGVVVGNLALFAAERNFFNAGELNLLTDLAGNISFALKNIGQQQKLDKLARIREISSEVNVAIVRIHDREALLRETCRIANTDGKFDLVWIAEIDQVKQKVQAVAWAGFSPEAAHAVNWSTINSAQGTMGTAILTRKPAVRNDIGLELPVGKLRQEAVLKGCHSTASLPLVIGDNVVGLMGLFVPEVEFFDEEELALLTEITGNISFALAHIEKEQKIARLSRIQAVMSGINAVIVRVRDRQKLLEETCRIAVEHGGFGIAWIGMLDPKTLEIVPAASAGVDADSLSATSRNTVPSDTSMVGRAIRDRRPVFSNELETEISPGGARRQEALRRGYHSLIVLPLVVGNKAVGSLSLFTKEPDFFTDEEIGLMSEVAANVSFALDLIQKSEALTNSEKKLDSILGTLQEVVWSMDPGSGRIVYVNAAVERLTGRVAADFLAQPRLWRRLVHSDDRASMRSAIRRLLQEGTLSHEFRIVLADGKERTVESSAHVRRAAAGEILRIDGTISDITERKRAESEIRRSNERFLMVVRATNDAVWDWDFANNTLWWNEGFTSLFGYPPEEIEPGPESWTQRIHPDDVSRITDGIHAVIDGLTELWSDEYRFRHRDGTYAHVFDRGFVIRDASGKATRMIGAMQDITERKHTEDRLRESEQVMRAAFENSAVGIVHTGLDDRYLRVNAKFCELLGYTREELQAMTTRDTNHPDELDQFGNASRLLLSGELEEYSSEKRFIRKNGSVLWAKRTVSLVKDAAGAPLYFIRVVEDIAVRKQAEATLLRINEELEDKVAARTAELQRARHDADAANQAKSSFLAAMSHEIRTPMNGVIGMIDVLHQSSLKGDQVEMVDLIRESAFSLLGIINDILDFSKIEAGKLELEREAFVVGDVVEGACSLLNGLADKKDVALIVYTDPAIPAQVLGDGLRLRQVLVNLINNAIKFSSGQLQMGRVSVRALLVEQSAEKVLVEIRVTDNGIGMDDATQARLFTAFTQADVSTTRHFGGTGLGLAIANNMVELMGGEITVQSVPGAGSTFKVRLPFAWLPGNAKTVEVASEVAGLCCVVVGDAGGLADDLAAYLKHAHADVERAPDLASAREQRAYRSGLSVWVVDASNEPQSPEHIRAAAHAEASQDVRFVVVLIERGKRRRPRMVARDMITVDGNALNRRTFLKAVAVAAGRASLEVEEVKSAFGKLAAIAPSRVEALRQGRLILIAEDNETNQKVILRQLALLGYAADIAADGREALEQWRSGDYALLLTDLHMPRMDGYELTKAIRDEEKDGKRIPIIALTANALKGEADHCRVVGMDDYRSKPSPLAELKSVLEKWLPVAEPGSDASTAFAQPPAAILPTATAIPVDVSVLKGLVGDDPELVHEFLRDFRASAARIGVELRTACVARQSAAVVAAAHKLRSSACAVGALALGDLCEAMEEEGKTGDCDSLNILLPRFESEMASVGKYLDSL